MPCGEQVFQICCSAGKSSDFLQTSGYLHARKRVLPKYVEDCPIGKAMQIWNSRDLKRAAALLFPKASRGNPFKGSLWATSSPRLDTALLCAAKKRGVESPGWQVSASLNWRLPPRTAKTKSTLGRHCQNYRFSPRRASINSGVVPQQPPMRLAPASTSRSICCANSPDSME